MVLKLLYGAAPSDPAGAARTVLTRAAYSCSRRDQPWGTGAANGPAEAHLAFADVPCAHVPPPRALADALAEDGDQPSEDMCHNHSVWEWPPGLAPSPMHAGATAPLLPVPACLGLGRVHVVTVHARNASGAAYASRGGDYLEARLEGARLKARPRTIDWGNGTYTLEILLPDDPLLDGAHVVLTCVLLFRRWGGLGNSPWSEYLTSKKLMILAPPHGEEAHFVLAREGACPGTSGAGARTPPLAPPTRSCRTVDFMSQPFWAGHWVALPPHAPSECPRGACTGDASRLPSPWVYRLPACTFHIFAAAEARTCLNASHVFSSGDSTWVDTQRTLLAHVLALDVTGWLHVDTFVLRGRSNDHGGHQSAPRSHGGSSAAPAARTPVWYADALRYAEPYLEAAAAHPTERELAATVGAAGMGSGAINVGVPFAAAPGAAAAAPLVRKWREHSHGIPVRDETLMDPAGRFNLTLRSTQIYNGAPTDSDQHHGFAVVYDSSWRGKNEVAFANYRSEHAVPDVVIVNSGLHDGLRHKDHRYATRDHALVLADALPFWERFHAWATVPAVQAVGGAQQCGPRMIWRSTVAPAGRSRTWAANPQKMEFFNAQVARGILAEHDSLPVATAAPAVAATAPAPGPAACPKFSHLGPLSWAFIDMFDVSFPKHYDNLWSDGGHYGRWNCLEGPGRCDLVDHMLVHILLNGLCTLAN